MLRINNIFIKIVWTSDKDQIQDGMAGQKGSFKSPLPTVSQESISDLPQAEVEAVFDLQNLDGSINNLDNSLQSRLEILASQRGVSPQMLVSEIVSLHLAAHEIEANTNIHYSKKQSTVSIQRGVKKMFLDPAELLADQIPVDEDFRDLI